jgi:hypothetical protein
MIRWLDVWQGNFIFTEFPTTFLSLSLAAFYGLGLVSVGAPRGFCPLTGLDRLFFLSFCSFPTYSLLIIYRNK